MIEVQYDSSRIRATCTAAGEEFLIATEIQLSPGAMLSWYRQACSGDPAVLEQRAAAEAISRLEAMHGQRAAAPQ